MIVTVTLNPAIDKTVEIDVLEQGGLNRIKKVELDAGGKGINVSKTIQKLGGKSIATGFLGGSSGRLIENVLQESGVKTDFVYVDGETRTNLKVYEATGEVTELNEPGPLPSKEQSDELMTKLLGYAGADTLFVLAGSIPAGMPTDIYQEITRQVHEKGAKVLMDADGELFASGLKAGPDLLKPNRVELERLFRMNDRASQEELVVMGKHLLREGASLVAVSLGSLGALFLTPEQSFKCPGLQVKAHSTVGAGDAMVAALAYGWDHKLSLPEQARLGMAVSAGAVTTIGTKPPSRETVDELLSQVTITELE